MACGMNNNILSAKAKNLFTLFYLLGCCALIHACWNVSHTLWLDLDMWQRGLLHSAGQIYMAGVYGGLLASVVAFLIYEAVALHWLRMKSFTRWVMLPG